MPAPIRPLGPVTVARRLLPVLGTLIALLLFATVRASAHPLSTSAVLLDVDTDEVTATVQLPIDQLDVALGTTYTADTVLAPDTIAHLRAYVQHHMSATGTDGQTWSTGVGGGRVESVDGVDHLLLDATLTPATGTVGEFTFAYDAVIDQLVSHRAFVSARDGHAGDYTTLAMLSWQTTSVVVTAAEPVAATGFLSSVELGVEHIGGGSDHLLFLIMLLLPAPLVAGGRRWTRRADPRRAALRVVHVVTAFAAGHSITLVLGATGLIHLPTRLVESGIALSVLVSAIHAIRPIVRRGEVFIAGSFGLLHGLAFAALLAELDLTRANLVLTLLGFNVGIELTQLLVVALVMPSLVLLSRTTLYTHARVTAATVGALLAAAWFAERSGLLAGNPLEPLGDLLVDHPVPLAGGLIALSVGAYAVKRLRLPATTPTLTAGTQEPSMTGTGRAVTVDP
ncbi:HupE/UreJ family protein [Actinokineospora auranticolor]|uniref:HupE/UreJ protein n=1 Tax=Actinokineospora auranticolor TaxID=155976 RepID=A0A2S6GDL9_9PSEU|nr:HupE/UreJ family protein [Actinokineospora auranticolor]PPK63319.1 HupE/UreJ protein [Actinokineospora auranticolor]